MNLYRQLTDLMKRESRAAAKITTSLGGGTWEAETQSGRTVILRGHGETGKRFFTTPTPAKSSPLPPIWT